MSLLLRLDAFSPPWELRTGLNIVAGTQLHESTLSGLPAAP
jgi:hypothetical protein